MTIERAAIAGGVGLERGAPDDGRDAVERHRPPGEQPQRALGLEHPPDRAVEPLGVISPRSTARRHRVDGGARVGGLQQQVGAGEEGADAGLGAVGVGHAGHVERVGDDHALEAERVAQDAGEDVGRHGARPELARVDARAARCGPTSPRPRRPRWRRGTAPARPSRAAPRSR